MAKVFKVGKYYHFRLLVNGRDKWQSTHQTNKEKAEVVAEQYTNAQKDKGAVEDFFQALMKKITTLPEEDRPAVRQRLAQRLMMMQRNTLTLTEAWQVWSDSPLKGNPGSVTTTRYAGQWQRFQKWATGRKLEFMHDVTPSETEEYARDLWRDKVSPRTFNSHVIFLRGMFTTLKSPAGLLSNPWSEIKAMEKRTQGRVNFTPEELVTICHNATGAMRCMIAVGLYTGLRQGDVVNLKWASIRPGKIELMPRKTARKGKTVTIPLHPVLDALLQERRAQVVGEYVFPEEAALYAREASAVSKQFQTFLGDCGIVTTEAKGEHRQRAIVRKGFHSLRHSFVSLCAANRVPQVAIQDLVGHGSPAMTALYSHADFAQKQSAIALLPAMVFENNGTTPNETKKPDPAPSTHADIADRRRLALLTRLRYPPPMSSPHHNARLWARLTRAAQQEVSAVLAALPREVRDRLTELPITFEPKPSAALVASGMDADRTLGLVTVMPSVGANEVTERLPQGILFLDNIREYVRSDGPEFRTQVRRTLLQEIGRYLGLDEDEVDQSEP